MIGSRVSIVTNGVGGGELTLFLPLYEVEVNNFLFQGCPAYTAPSTILEVSTGPAISAMHSFDIGEEDVGAEVGLVCALNRRVETRLGYE